MKIFIGLLALVLQQIVVVHCQQCGANSNENPCWSPCERTCRTRFRSNDILCLDVCKFGCTCIQGYLKHDNGTCVPENECSEPLCYENEEYLECGSCEKTCNTYNNTCLSCLAVCTPGCYCKEGFIRSPNFKTQCLTVSECEASKTCSGANEKFDYCPSQCSEDCASADQTCIIDANRCCEPACRCITGYYRVNGTCVSKEQCNISKYGRRSIYYRG